jgi:hypothetical protein
MCEAAPLSVCVVWRNSLRDSEQDAPRKIRTVTQGINKKYKPRGMKQFSSASKHRSPRKPVPLPSTVSSTISRHELNCVQVQGSHLHCSCTMLQHEHAFVVVVS